MSLRSTTWRLISLPLLMVFCTSELLGATALSGLGTVVRPSSPYDPAQPFMVYVPGDVLSEITTTESLGSGTAFARPIGQTVLGATDALGVFPHLPYKPIDARAGVTAVQDASIRWAKPFHSGLFGGGFYQGFKKTLMSKLHDNHIYIVTGLRALGALAQANPDQFFRGFGTFDASGQFQANADLPVEMNNPVAPEESPRQLLEQVMTKVRETHDILSGILIMPPAAIDPDLMLNWLDSVNLGPQVRFSQAPESQKALVGDEAQVKAHLQQYCATTYVPWLVAQATEQGVLEWPTFREAGLSEALVQTRLHSSRSSETLPVGLPGLSMPSTSGGTRDQATLRTLEVVPRRDARTGRLGYGEKALEEETPAGTLFENLKQWGWVTDGTELSAEVDLGNDFRTRSFREALLHTPFTTLTFHFVQSQLAKLAYVRTRFDHLKSEPTPPGEPPQPKISADDLWALIQYYTQLEGDSRHLQSFNHAFRSFFHIAERARFARMKTIPGLAYVANVLIEDGFSPKAAPEEFQREWIRRWGQLGSYHICEALAYQQFYDQYLLASSGKRDIPELTDRQGKSNRVVTLSSPELFSFFDFPEPQDRLLKEWNHQAALFKPEAVFPALKGWGYFYDILVRLGHVPLPTAVSQQPYVLGDTLDQYKVAFIPGLIAPPTVMWDSLLSDLIFMPLDLTTLPEFLPESAPEGQWLYQDGGYRPAASVANVKEMTSDYLTYQFEQSNYEALKEISLYLFRNRVGFTPQEQYLFIMSYFKEYLLPLAYLFQSFTTHVFDDSRLTELLYFEVPKGAISTDLMVMLQGEWTNAQSGGNDFVVRNTLPEDAWKLDVGTQGQNLMISFLDPMLAAFKKPPPVEDATSYGKLENAIAKLTHYLDQRASWCWSTPRHTLPIQGDQVIASMQFSEDPLSRPVLQVRARSDSQSPYLFPQVSQGEGSAQGVTEPFPVDALKTADPQTRELWLNLMCGFPRFLRYYFDGYIDLAQQYQRAMQIFRHIELFQRKRLMDTAHLTYLEGIPDRAVFQLDYAMVDARERDQGKLNRTVYAQEVSRYLREKQAYITTFDNVQSMAQGAFKADYGTTEYVHALEQVYLGLVPAKSLGGKSIGAAVYKAAAQAANERGEQIVGALENQLTQEQDIRTKLKREDAAEVEEARKKTAPWWRAAHEVINGVMQQYVSEDPRLDHYDFECREESNLTELHLVYQNKLACSLQRQVVYKIMLQRTLKKYRDAMETFSDMKNFASDETDPFVRMIRWAAWKFEALLTDTNLKEVGKELEDVTRPKQQGLPFAALAAAQNPQLAAQASEAGAAQQQPPEDLSWEDALGEVERVQVDIVGSFLRDMISVVQRFRPESSGSEDAVSYFVNVLSTYRTAIKQAFGERSTIPGVPGHYFGQRIQGLRSVYWFYGPNVLFENPNYVPQNEDLVAIGDYFDQFYRLIPLQGDRSIPGLSFNEKKDLTGMSFEDDRHRYRSDRRAMIELLRHFDLQLLKYGMNNIVNAKLLLGDDKALQPVSHDLYRQVGELGSDDVVQEHFMGRADIYGEAAPFDWTLFVYNRKSLQWWHNLVADWKVLGVFTPPEVGNFSPAGNRTALKPYGHEDWLNMNAMVGRIGQRLGWTERESNWQMQLHKWFCHVGARLQGGTLAQDMLASRTFKWSWTPDFVGELRWRVLDIFGDAPPVPETVIDRRQETAEKLDTYAFVQFQEEFENWYCDVYSIDRESPPSGPFTLAELSTVQTADQRIAAAKQELQEENFRTGSQDLKMIQGAKVYESALLWTYLEMLNVYVMEPYMKSGFALQKLFGKLDLTLRSHLGLFAHETKEKGSLAYEAMVKFGERANHFYTKVAEFKGGEVIQAFTNGGVLRSFLDRVEHPSRELPKSHAYQDLQRRMFGVLNLDLQRQVPGGSEENATPYVITDQGKVDVPVLLGGDEAGMLNFISGEEPWKFQETRMMDRLPGGRDYLKDRAEDATGWVAKKVTGSRLGLTSAVGRPLGRKRSSCITEGELVPEAVLKGGSLLSQEEFKALDSQAQKQYLSSVELVNAMEQYGAYLEVAPGTKNEEQPGFCFLKRLAFNTAFQLLLGKQSVEQEADQYWKNYEKQQITPVPEAEKVTPPCTQLSNTYPSNLKWSVGARSVKELETLLTEKTPDVLNQRYCHEVMYAFKVADVFRRVTGYGSDLPKEDALQRKPQADVDDDLGNVLPPAPQVPPEWLASSKPGEEPPPIRQPFAALNLLVVHQDGMNELEQWRNLFIQNIALTYPQLDAEVDRPEAFGGIMTGPNKERRFIKRAFVEIVKEHAPGLISPLQNLVRELTQHPGPICELFNAQMLPEEPRVALGQTPQLQELLSAKLAGNTYVLGSNLCRSIEAVSGFTHTRWAHPPEGEPRLERAQELMNLDVQRRYGQLMERLLDVFPWMSDVPLPGGGGEQKANLHLWVVNYGAEGPGTALYEWSRTNDHHPAARGLREFVKDDTERVGYTGILRSSIHENIELIALQYHTSHNAIRRSSEFSVQRLENLQGEAREREEARFEAMDRAVLFNLLAQRFSIPKLYDQVRAEVGPRYDKFYYFFVPVQVWNQFKRYEQYQSVVSTFTSTIFAIQITMSFIPMMNILRGFTHKMIGWGIRAFRYARLSAQVGAVAGFMVATAVSLFASYTLMAAVGYRFFNFFGAGWRPIKMAMFGTTLVGSIFFGLNKMQLASWLFRGITPVLHTFLQLGWYFFMMDLVMYFGDKVTWDYATREYGYVQSLYETYLTRQQFKVNQNSSISDMYQREIEMMGEFPGNHTAKQARKMESPEADPLAVPARLEHAPIFSEYHYVKHLYNTTQMALAYMWFGILMAGAMDFAQLKTYMRFKGININPYRGSPQWLPVEFRGTEGTMDDLARPTRKHLGSLDDGFGERLKASVSQAYGGSQFPDLRPARMGTDPVKLSRVMTDLLRSMAWATSQGVRGGWQDAALQTRSTLRSLFEDSQITAIIREGAGGRGDDLLAAVYRDIERIEFDTMSETVHDAYRLGSADHHPALAQALSILEQRHQGAFFLGKLSDAIVTRMQGKKVTPRTFVKQWAFHNAKWGTVMARVERFRSFGKKLDKARLQHPELSPEALRASHPEWTEDVARSQSEGLLRSRVKEEILMTTDWKTVDNEMEFQIIRWVLWNNGVIQFLKTHGLFWAGRAAKKVFTIPQWGPKTLGRVAGVMNSGVKSWSRAHYGESLEDAEARMMGQISAGVARALAKRRALDLEGYIMDLRDMVPSLIESLEQAPANLDLPVWMREAVKDVVRDYRQLQASAGVTDTADPEMIPGKLGVFQRADDQDVEAVRGFLDLWSIGVLRQPADQGPQAQLVKEISTSQLIAGLNRYELNDFLWQLQGLSLESGLVPDDLKAVLSETVHIPVADLPAVLEPSTIGETLLRRGKQYSHLYTQRLLGLLMSRVVLKHALPLDRYEALVKFKLALIQRVDQLKSGALTADSMPFRLVMPEDLDVLRPHMRVDELMSLAEGEIQYLQATQAIDGRTPDGQAYRLYTAHERDYLEFFTNIEVPRDWVRVFGAVGPYLFYQAHQAGAVRHLQRVTSGGRFHYPGLGFQTLMDDWRRDLRQTGTGRSP